MRAVSGRESEVSGFATLPARPILGYARGDNEEREDRTRSLARSHFSQLGGHREVEFEIESGTRVR